VRKYLNRLTLFRFLKIIQLVSLIKRDDLQMKEVEVWEHVLNGVLHKIQLLKSRS
jgi:hypothetical protein